MTAPTLILRMESRIQKYHYLSPFTIVKSSIGIPKITIHFVQLNRIRYLIEQKHFWRMIGLKFEIKGDPLLVSGDRESTVRLKQMLQIIPYAANWTFSNESWISKNTWLYTHIIFCLSQKLFSLPTTFFFESFISCVLCKIHLLTHSLAKCKAYYTTYFATSTYFAY